MKIKILVSAYACNPLSSSKLHPGEDITGWRLMLELSRFFDLHVIADTYNKEGVENFLAREKLDGVKFYFISLPPSLQWLYQIAFGKRIYYYLWQISAWRLAVKLHRQFNFTAAHHLTFGNYWIPSFIGAFLPVPFIWGPLGGGQMVPASFLKEYALGRRLGEYCRQIAQWFGRNILIPSRRCLEKAKIILVCNEDTRSMIPKKYLSKVYLFPVNGVAEDEFAPDDSSGGGGGEFLVLSAGRLDALKGFSIAIRAFSLFAKGSADAILEIVGDGPEEVRLKELTRLLKIEERVRFTPWLKRKDLFLKMRSCQVFLFPSFRDGGGAVVVEAMASAKPIIGLNIGGPGFHIQPEWGIKIEPKDPEYVTKEIAVALKILYNNTALRLKMGEAASRRAKEYYLWSKLGDRLREIHEVVLK
jgi:glycosyltransferase involved in cell wall biosynthesis